MTPDDLGDLAETMVPVAQRLVGAVHDDGPGEVARALAGRSPQELYALIVVLAGMVDPNRTPSELLAWTNFAALPTRQESLFAAMTHHDPSSAWPDALCIQLHQEYRHEGLDPARAAVARLGYLEWEKRRKRRHRVAVDAAAKGTTQKSVSNVN